MSKKVKTTKRKVGRPTLESMGLPPRIRRNFNMQRTPQFDSDLMFIRQVMAVRKGVPIAQISRTEAVNEAMGICAKLLVAQRDNVSCPHCNGLGYNYVLGGDDDQPCPRCTPPDNEIPF